MFPDLRERSTSYELMDDLSIGGNDLAQALRELRVINAVLGAAWPTIEGIERLWCTAGRPRNLTVLDIGAGSGDLNQAVLAWADRHGIQVRIILIDIHPETCHAAARYYRNESRVQVVCSDVFNLAICSVDIVACSLFTHHFAAEQLPLVYRAMVRVAGYGVVVNDLHRTLVAWIAIRVATHILSRNRMIRHDAPLSVRRGFRSSDLRSLTSEPELARLRVDWRPLFRYLIVVPGNAYAS